jgi:coiled-coil and C2 domain-containing protein 2A
MDPVINLIKEDDIDYVPGYEDSIFLINTTKWLKTIKENILLKNRNIKIFAENFDGYSIFIPRYIRPQKPPEIILDEVHNINDQFSIEKVARYVSLIPFVDDAISIDSDTLPDCWCTDEQFITLGFGDYTEHAILLCNYFNYIDKAQNKPCTSYLVLCKAHPEGYSAYVMRMNDNCLDVEFWNAKTGECFYFDKRYQEAKLLCLTVNKSFYMNKNSIDIICPLKEIGCLISSDNVYVNIQDAYDPATIEVNIKNTKNWMPFLNDFSRKKYFPDGISSIQKDLIYEEPTKEESLNLTNTIYDHIKREVEISRASLEVDGIPLRTRWDRSRSDEIVDILDRYDLSYLEKKQSCIDVILI